MSTAYAVTRVLKARSHYSSASTGYGAAELRPGDADLPGEKAAIHESEGAFGEFPTKSPVSMRISVVVEAGGPEEADRAAEPRFDEVLDVVDGTAIQFSVHDLSEVGFVRNLADGKVYPRMPAWLSGSNGMGMVASVKHGLFAPPSLAQSLLIYTATELGARFKRSLHWRRKARLETNLQLRVLFRWFALESVWTLKKKNDNVSPRIMWCLGFPNGARERDVDVALRQSLSGIEDYRTFKRNLENKLDEVRTFRNDTAHNGFRQIDVAADRLQAYDRLTYFACIDAHHLVQDGLLSGVSTAQDLFDQLPRLFNAGYDERRVRERMETIRSRDTSYLL